MLRSTQSERCRRRAASRRRIPCRVSGRGSSDAVTLDAAWALGDEARRGHLAPGTFGDVTILSGDVSAATPDEIRAMDVLATIVGGIPAYCPDSEVCSQLGG